MGYARHKFEVFQNPGKPENSQNLDNADDPIVATDSGRAVTIINTVLTRSICKSVALP